MFPEIQTRLGKRLCGGLSHVQNRDGAATQHRQDRKQRLSVDLSGTRNGGREHAEDDHHVHRRVLQGQDGMSMPAAASNQKNTAESCRVVHGNVGVETPTPN